jgi:hypothetical protein
VEFKLVYGPYAVFRAMLDVGWLAQTVGSSTGYRTSLTMPTPSSGFIFKHRLNPVLVARDKGVAETALHHFR